MTEHLDPLIDVSRCDNEKTKPFLADALACYQASAYREAIVATWIAVVFDSIAKVRELALTGDKQANTYLARVEKMYQEKDPQKAISQAQEFERTILEAAKDQFEFLSLLQYKDLLRLHEDRHRCAHPSMHSLEEPYQPTKELVQYHLQNAMFYLFQHPPVQGKVAERYIWDDIHSAYFPTTIHDASERLTRGPLARPKESLLRGIIVGLTKDVLTTQRPPEERQRQYAALGAALQLSYQKDERKHQGDELLHRELTPIVGLLSDKQWPAVITYLSLIPTAWLALSEPERKKAVRFLQQCPLEDAEHVLIEALTIEGLREIAGKRLPELSIDTLATLLSQRQQPESVEEALQRWGNAASYEEAKVQGKKLIIPLFPALQGSQIIQMIALFWQNSQLFDSYFTWDIMLDLFKHSRQYAQETKQAWVQLYERCCEVSNGELIQRVPSILSLIEDAYPNDLDPVRLAARKQYISQMEKKAAEDDYTFP